VLAQRWLIRRQRGEPQTGAPGWARRLPRRARARARARPARAPLLSSAAAPHPLALPAPAAAGHLPARPEGLITGKVGSELTTEQAYDAAKVVGLNILATLKAEVGDLDRVKKVVKLTAFVNCVDGFQAQPKVVNGCSDLIAAVFGDKGKHARSAVGVNALPLNVPVEVEAIVEVE